MERAGEFGADVVIDQTAGPWDAGVEPVDLVFDPAGGERLARSPGVCRGWPARLGGRGAAAGERCRRRVLRGGANRRELAQIAALLNGGSPAPAIDSMFNLEEAVSAFERSLASGKSGKVVLEVAR